jgi:hypothetical protein
MSQSVSLAFYKGTPLEMRCPIETIMKSAQNMINKGHQFGDNDEIQIQHYTEQMDTMEQSLVNAFGTNKEISLRDVSRLWGDKFDMNCSLWYLNIGALLILKAIKDDNFNGFLKMEGDLTTIWKEKNLFNLCSVCAKKGSWKRCSVCKHDYYCGVECQKADWKRHKKENH